MTTSAFLIAGPHFNGPWPTWLWVAVAVTTVVVIIVALVLNRL